MFFKLGFKSLIVETKPMTLIILYKNDVCLVLIAVIPSPEARKNLMKLAQRMIRTFSLNMSTSSGQSWTALSDSPEDSVRITTRKITNPGQPNGVILSAVSTTWLPYSHSKVFDLLKDERRRSQVLLLQFCFTH